MGQHLIGKLQQQKGGAINNPFLSTPEEINDLSLASGIYRVNVDYRNTNVLLPKTYGGFLRGSLIVLMSPTNPNANYKIFIPFDINKPMITMA